jgi:hypothetical protein
MTSVIENTMKYLTSLKEEFVSNMIFFLILVIIIFMLWYFFYMRNLAARECSRMDSLYKKLDGNLRSINSNDKQCGYTLKDYYIMTAYNACSGGSYKNDFVDICNLKSVIKQGVRGLDFEVYSLNDEPIVATSTTDSYFIKETYNSVKFSDILYTIQNHAFSNSTAPNPADPIILHLRIKSTNQKMYENFANLFKSYNTLLLGKDYSYENHNTNLGDVPLLKLAGKIIVIVDRSNTSFMENENFLEYVNMTSNSIFMRALHYTDIKQTPDVNELIEFNKRNMTIGMPDIGSNPANMSGMLVRETGSQMLAMRYQNVDEFLGENTLFFDRSGYAFVLKPEKFRYKPVTIAAPTPQRPELSYATRTISKDYYNFNI